MSNKSEVSFIQECFPVGTEINLAVTVTDERTPVDLLCLLNDKPVTAPDLLKGLKLNEVGYRDLMKHRRLVAEQLQQKLRSYRDDQCGDVSLLEDMEFLITELTRTTYVRAVDTRVTGKSDAQYKYCPECRGVKSVTTFIRDGKSEDSRAACCTDCEEQIYRDIYVRLGNRGYDHVDRIRARDAVERTVKIAGITYKGTCCCKCSKNKAWELFPTTPFYPTGHQPFCSACEQLQKQESSCKRST